MPFRSQAQAKFLFSQHPDIAKKWEAESSQHISSLPEHVTKPSKFPAPKKKYDGRTRGMKRLGLKKYQMK